MRQSDFKTFWLRAAAAMFTLTLLILAACGEDEPQADPVTVQFTASNPATIEEDGGAKNITLSLSSAATKDGTITLSATPANANTFATFPAEINITKGSTSAQFALTPINNAVIDATAKVITFTLEDPSSGFKLGDKTTHTVTITDDEGPTTANFAVAAGSVAENAAAGIDVVIGLSSAADVAGSIEVTMTPSAAAVTTTPAATAGVITVPVAVGETSVSFKVVPVNNEVNGDGFEVAFKITGASGGVTVGTSVDYTLTVEDDDDIVLRTIADVRAMFTGSAAPITQPTKIEGIVISSNDNTTARNAWIHDGTAGILLRFNANNTFVLGDKIEVEVTSSTLQEFNGTLQIGNNDLANDKASKTGTGALPAYKTITIAQLESDEYEGELVEVGDAEFTAADGIRNFNYNSGLGIGNNEFKVDTETAVFRVENYAPFRTTAMPIGKGTIRGIASEFTTTGTIFQITPQTSADFFAPNPSGSIDLTQSLTDFGSVDNGQESAIQQYTVAGTTLTEDIIVTASAGFKVSADNTIFDATATLPSAGGTVYVKFTPATGSDQAIEGTLVHQSTGALPVIVNVTGTETGNGAAALQTLALWTFETLPSTYSVTAASVTGLLAESGLQSGVASASGVHASAATVYSSPAGNGTARSFSSNTWAVDDYYQFSLNSSGYSDIKISWDQMGSNTGPQSFVLQYSTDGSNFTQFGSAYTVINDSWSAGTVKTTSSYNVDLSSVTTLNNAATLVFRLVVAPGSTSIGGAAIATGGTGRVDNVKVEGR